MLWSRGVGREPAFLPGRRMPSTLLLRRIDLYQPPFVEGATRRDGDVTAVPSRVDRIGADAAGEPTQRPIKANRRRMTTGTFDIRARIASVSGPSCRSASGLGSCRLCGTSMSGSVDGAFPGPTLRHGRRVGIDGDGGGPRPGAPAHGGTLGPRGTTPGKGRVARAPSCLSDSTRRACLRDEWPQARRVEGRNACALDHRLEPMSVSTPQLRVHYAISSPSNITGRPATIVAVGRPLR